MDTRDFLILKLQELGLDFITSNKISYDVDSLIINGRYLKELLGDEDEELIEDIINLITLYNSGEFSSNIYDGIWD